MKKFKNNLLGCHGYSKESSSLQMVIFVPAQLFSSFLFNFLFKLFLKVDFNFIFDILVKINFAPILSEIVNFGFLLKFNIVERSRPKSFE